MFKNCPICSGNIINKHNNLFGDYSLYKCNNCSLEFINSQPNNEILRNIYTENYYKAWGISGDQENKYIKEMKKNTFNLRLIEIIKHKKTGKILDIGCATGFFLEKAQELGFDSYGIELSEYSSKIAKTKFGNNKIFNGTVEDSDFEDKFFDIICMSDLIEHVINPIGVINKCYKLLADDGIIMIMTPDTDSFTAKIMGKYWSQYKLEHLFYFNKKSLLTLLGNNFIILNDMKAYKFLNLNYFYTQFIVYKNAIITPIIKLIKFVLPNSTLNYNFRITLGEKVWILKKNNT